MTPTKEQQELDIVLKLNQLTHDRKIDWKEPSITGSAFDLRTLYSARYKGYEVSIVFEPNPIGVGEHVLKLKPEGAGAPSVIRAEAAISDLLDTIRWVRDTPDPQLDEFSRLLDSDL